MTRLSVLPAINDVNTVNTRLTDISLIHDFSITEILHEINFGDSISVKSAFLTRLEGLNFDF